MPPCKKSGAKDVDAMAHSAKKAAVGAAQAKAKTRHADDGVRYRVVLREEDDQHDISSETTIGVFKSYAKAESLARSHLTDQWSRDFFDEYVEPEADTGEPFEIYALCPEGEEMWVTIETEKSGNKPYRVIRRVHDHHNKAPHPEKSTQGHYATQEEALDALKQDLLDEWGKDFFDEYRESEEGEVSGGYEVYALAPEGEEFWVYYEHDEADEDTSMDEAADKDGSESEEDSDGSDSE